MLLYLTPTGVWLISVVRSNIMHSNSWEQSHFGAYQRTATWSPLINYKQQHNVTYLAVFAAKLHHINQHATYVTRTHQTQQKDATLLQAMCYNKSLYRNYFSSDISLISHHMYRIYICLNIRYLHTYYGDATEQKNNISHIKKQTKNIKFLDPDAEHPKT